MSIPKFSWQLLAVVAVLWATPASPDSGVHRDANGALEAPQVVKLFEEADAAAAEGNHFLELRRLCDAARLGSVEAAYRAGTMFAFGKGVARNNAHAVELLSIAASQGHEAAARLLAPIGAFHPEVTPECLTNPDALIAEAQPENLPPAARELWFDSADMSAAKRRLFELVRRVSPTYKIDERLVLIMMALESGFNPGAVSPKNAQGLMQLIPDTAERFNVKDPFNPEQNLRGGLAYLRWLMSYYEGNVELVVAAYNAGEKAVDRYQGVPPYRETQTYVRRILTMYRSAFHPFDRDPIVRSPLVGKRVTTIRQ